MALVYKYLRDEQSRDVCDRAASLLDKARGSGPNVQVYESAVPQYTGWGVPLCGGSEAPPGNLGVGILEEIKSGVENQDPHPNLTSEERTELLGYYAAAVELPDDWYWNDGT